MKKLLVILGAGSSIPVGMPSVAAIDSLMAGWSDEWAREQRLDNYYSKTWDAVASYYGASTASIRPTPNFEKVLGEMIGLAHWMEPSPFGHALRQLISPDGQPLGMSFGSGPYAATVSVTDQVTYLLKKLAGHMRAQCDSARITAEGGFPQYKALFDRLRATFDVGAFNLNYDTALLTAWPEAFAGFSRDGVFAPNAIHQRTEWGFAYHLHGSVHHSLVHPFGDDVCWQEDLSGTFFDGHQGNATDRRSDNRSFPKTSLIAGGFKLDQLLVEPFQSFYAALIRRVYEADAILIGGYGFGDVHVNRALLNRMRQPGERPPALILTYSRNADPMEFRNDEWGRNVNISLHAPTGFHEPGHASPPHIDELVARGGFEVSSVHKVAIWHGGFVEAVRRIDAWIPWLEGIVDDNALKS
ncbi:SIR2-like domain-containing protein [Bradyrhizobium sp. Ghvi]|uniref:SIR2 family protein n=1 Tax=Bradyrhizobium sp. Ghvi TaxID=1855319 RepID=UPI0008EDE594|nr:SIR2 family protein [Bradyrhizobium sp. Ghvi]SFQ01615.1 SIR2-like domain-containing protein [Bradyrhizobium sp. Ghvi]